MPRWDVQSDAMSNNHLIHHINLALNIQSEDKDLEQINVQINAYRDMILACVNEYFDSINIEEHIIIDHLEINIRNVRNKEDIKAQIAAQLQQQLHLYLKKTFNQAENLTSDSPNQNLNVDTNFNIEIILTFLKTGQFLFETHKKFFQNTENKSIVNQNLTDFWKEKSVDFLLDFLIEHPNSFWRIQYYFKDIAAEFNQKLIISNSINKDFLQKIWKDFVVEFSTISSHFPEDNWRYFFQVLKKFGQQTSMEIRWIILLIILMEQRNLVFLQAIKNAVASPKSEVNNRAEYAGLVQNYLHRTVVNESFKCLIAKYLESFIYSDDLLDIYGVDKEFHTDHLISTEQGATYTDNCGSLLLHPFFKHFFNEFDLLDKNQFKDETAKIKAIQILHFAVTSSESSDEQSIHFLKLLVDLPQNTFVVFSETLTKVEKSKCMELVQQLISEWKILKSTSVETVQQNFLQRKGLVHIQEKNIEIQLEKSGFDILLEQFPYNYSIVKLPWQNKLFFLVS